jgi:hypothetical protein
MDPACNSVSTIKAESRSAETRNTIAVNDIYISYVVKGNLIRVIQSVSGDKTLLKGHKGHITDIQFANSGGDTLCSVDMNGGEDNIIVWKLLLVENTLSFDVVIKLSVPACMVRPHPTQRGVWAVSDGIEFAIFSEKHSSNVTKYTQFHLHKNSFTNSECIQGILSCLK